MARHISALFFLVCLILFVVGTVFTLPPHTDDWKIDKLEASQWIRGETTHQTEKELEDKLAYKSQATGLWGAIRYGFFNTGSNGVVIGKEGWLFTKEEFEVGENFTQNVEQNTQRMHDAITTLQEHNITPLILWIPAKARVHTDKLWSDTKRPALHKNLTPPEGLPLIDLSDLMRDTGFMRTDTHWSQEAARETAELVGDFVTLGGSELQLTPKIFNTTTENNGYKIGHPYEGDLTEFVPTGIFPGPTSFFGEGKEVIQKYITTAESSADSLSLFGDEVIDVTLIGTSYSAQEDWHFEGFLKQALQSDVLNLADEGQGPFAPMDAFLTRVKAGEVSTKLVIWEFPERYLPRDYEPEESN